MTGTVEISLAGRRLLLRFNNYSVDAMRKQLLGLAPKATIDALAKDKKIGYEEAAQKVINDIVAQNEMMALQALIYSGLCGDSGPRFQLPVMTIQEVGEALANLTPEEMTGMFTQVQTARKEANGPEVKKKAANPSRRKKS